MLSPGTKLTQTQIPSIDIYFYSDPQRIPAHSKITRMMIKAFERERGKARVSGLMTASCRQKDAGGRMRRCPGFWLAGRQQPPGPHGACAAAAGRRLLRQAWVRERRPQGRRRVEGKWTQGLGTPKRSSQGNRVLQAELGHPLLCRQGAGSPPARPPCTRPWWTQNANCKKKQEKLQKIRMLKPTKISRNCQRAHKCVLTWRKCDARSRHSSNLVRKHLPWLSQSRVSLWNFKLPRDMGKHLGTGPQNNAP